MHNISAFDVLGIIIALPFNFLIFLDYFLKGKRYIKLATHANFVGITYPKFHVNATITTMKLYERKLIYIRLSFHQEDEIDEHFANINE